MYMHACCVWRCVNVHLHMDICERGRASHGSSGCPGLGFITVTPVILDLSALATLLGWAQLHHFSFMQLIPMGCECKSRV